jgi:hypothetical protein
MCKTKKVQDQYTYRETIKANTVDEHGDDECNTDSQGDQRLEVAEFKSIREISTEKS